MELTAGVFMFMCAGLLVGESTAEPAPKDVRGRSRAVASQDAMETNGQSVGYIYINARTGERVVTYAPPQPRSRSPFFINQDYVANGSAFWPLDLPAPLRTGHSVRDWGDVEFDSAIDAVSVAYSTNIGNGPSVPGFALTLTWYDSDGGFNDASAIPVWAVDVQDAPGGAAGAMATWILFIDLTGVAEFEIGDTDGSFIGMNGTTSTGRDMDDTDGCPKADFGWSYMFDQAGTGLPVGTCGPLLVLPASADVFEDDDFPTGASGNADGVTDALDLYDASGGHVMTFDLGGWSSGSAPYASVWMTLYGKKGLQCGCELADYNGDGCVDMYDFLDFFSDLNDCIISPGPGCGTFGDPDLFPDGAYNALDVAAFLDMWSNCN